MLLEKSRDASSSREVGRSSALADDVPRTILVRDTLRSISPF